jgi:hypothetical protein
VQKAAAYHQFPTKFAYSTHNTVDKNMHARKRRLVKQAFSVKSMEIWTNVQRRQIDIFCREIGPDLNSNHQSPELQWSPPRKMSDYCESTSGLLISKI